MTAIADILSRSSGLIEDFRGDVEPLAAMMRASWADGESPPYLYTGELLTDCLRYPGAGHELAPAIYHDSEIVAFAAGLPRRALVGGTERRLLISAFLTVAPEHKAAGYGIVVWSELMRRAEAAGFDGVVSYCVDGEAMHRMIPQSCRLLGLPVTRIKSFSYLVRTFAGPLSDRAEAGWPSAVDLVRAAAHGNGGNDDDDHHHGGLWRVWSEPEARWQLSRLGAASVAAGDDPGAGVLTGSVVTVADRDRTRCLVVDDILWGALAPDHRQALVHRLLTRAAAHGARFGIVPLLGYADLRPFMSAGFMHSPHTMHAYLTLWDGSAPDEPVERYYLDVI